MQKNQMFENIFEHKQTSINFTSTSGLSSYPLHWHNYVEIIRADRTGVLYEVNGHKYTLSKNDFLFIWPGELHALLYQIAPSHTQILQFDHALLSERYEFQKISFLFHALRHVALLQDPAFVRALGSKFDLIQETFHSEDSFSEVRSCMQLFDFFLLTGEYLLGTSSSYQKKINYHNTRQTERMLAICSYLSLHCDEAITLDSASRMAGFSRYHFSRLFKSFTNDSLNEFIMKERLRRAEELLHFTDLSITDIALRSGFSSISTFNRVFKKIKHCSPTQFRELQSS